MSLSSFLVCLIRRNVVVRSSSSPLSSLQRTNKKKITIPYRFLPVVIGAIIVIFASSIFAVLPPPILSNQSPSAFATFPGENGKIAFVSTRDGNYEIFAMNADGGEQINISNDRFDDNDPDWSPDGTKVVFDSIRPPGSGNELWIMNAEGSDPRMLTNNPDNDEHPSWSSDGEKIAFTSYRSQL